MGKFLSLFVILAISSVSQQSFAKDTKLSFFVTSVGMGDGANLNGLKGADAHCQKLAESTTSSNKIWRAYLSTKVAGQKQINARDRIGKGPWYNAKGIMIAKNIDDLHSANNISKENALSEKGTLVNGRSDKPNQHDILTGTLESGTASDANCNNWISSGTGTATLGHHDKKGPANRISWNSAHESFGCSIDKLKVTGGNGYFYCFAID